MANAIEAAATLEPDRSDPARNALIVRALRVLSEGPRPDDYLPVPSELRAAVERELELAQSIHPTVIMAESVKKKVFQDRVLSFHHARNIVVAMRFDEGVVVLAAGNEIGAVLRAIPSELRGGFGVEFPHSTSAIPG